jgi:hypothetical protein
MSHSDVHASPRRGAQASHDPTSGETRIPLRVYAIDVVLGDVELVLSRVEVEELHATLADCLTNRPEGRCSLPLEPS